MKIRSISLAAALACVASSSFALTPAQITAGNSAGATVQLWLSGASAPTAAVYGAVRKLCVDANSNGAPDDLHVYVSGNPAAAADAVPGKSAAGKFAAYACTMGSLAGADLDGKQAIVYHTFDIGSFEAYTPHLYLAGEVNTNVAATVARLNDVTAGGSTCAIIAGTVDPTYKNCGSTSVNMGTTAAPAIAANGGVIPTTGVPVAPVGGLSDTEYVLNQLNLSIIKSVGDIGSELPTNVGQGFGLAASWPLYNAMQQAQGIVATTAANGEACDATFDGAGVITSVNTTVACQPSINKQKYAALVSSAGVGDKDGSLLGAPAGSVITVERRVGTSGTQSGSNAFFLNAPCASGTPGGALSPAGSNSATSVSFNGGKVVVRSNAGSGNVKTNLTAGTNAKTYAIGALSLENVPSSSEKFAFLKINGVSPTTDAKQRATAIAGDYEYWYELVAFKASAASAEGVNLVDNLAVALADPAITDLNGLFVTAAAGVTGTNVSKGYKNGNACSPAIQ